MHELGIAKDFWAAIKHAAEGNKLKKVSKIVIMLGEASGIEEDFLRHSLKDHILPGTIGENAQLVIEKEKLVSRCRGCREIITKENVKGLSCPNCGGQDIEIVSGKDAYVKDIEGE